VNETTLGLVAAISLAIVAWFLGGRRKSDADTTETITKAAGHMIEQLRQELQRLTLEVDILRRENAEYRLTLDRQTVQLDRQEQLIRALEAKVAAVGDDGR
jgi:hypothetical protein